MRTLIVVASLAVNFVALGALEWSAQQAQSAPNGEVSIAQLPDSAELASYAELRPSYHAVKAL